jgi:hypothetical protein
MYDFIVKHPFLYSNAGDWDSWPCPPDTKILKGVVAAVSGSGFMAYSKASWKPGASVVPIYGIITHFLDTFFQIMGTLLRRTPNKVEI